MINNPFSLFAQFQDVIAIRLFTKEDFIACDEDLQKKLGTDRFVSLNQVHGNTSIIARSPSRREKEADGSLTDARNLWLSIRSADCQSFIIYDPLLEVVGVLHAGWKGLLCGAIPSFFKTMNAEWVIDTSRMLIGASPSLCTHCAEFTNPLLELSGIDPQFFRGRNADLRAIADDQFLQCGIQKHHMERMPDCTRCSHETYWSYRGGNKEALQQEGGRNIVACALL